MTRRRLGEQSRVAEEAALALTPSNLATRAVRNVGWNAVSEAIRALVPLTALYLARTLSTRGFGIFVLAQTAANYSTLLVDLSTNSLYATREVATAPTKRREISTLLSLRMCGGVAVALTLSLYGLLWGGPPFGTSTTLLIAAFVLAYACFADWAARGLEDMRSLVAGYGVLSLTYLFLSLLLVDGSSDVRLALVCWVAAQVAAAMFLLIRLSWRGQAGPPAWPSLGSFASRFPHSVRFTLAGMLTVSLWQATPVVVAWLVGTSAAGAFAGCLRVVATVVTAGLLLPTAVLPVLANTRDRPQMLHSLLWGLTRLMFLLGLPFAVLGTFWADEVLSALLGPDYGSASSAFAVLVWVIPVWFVASSLEYALVALGEEARRLRCLSAGFLVLAVSCPPLVALYGILGGAISCLLAAGAILTGVSLAVRRSSLAFGDTRSAASGMCLVGITLATAYLSSTAESGPVGVVGLLLVYPIYAQVSGLISIREVSLLWSRHREAADRRGDAGLPGGGEAS
jgi:O-antigen/teichoic acid export membrane protein